MCYNKPELKLSDDDLDLIIRCLGATKYSDESVKVLYEKLWTWKMNYRRKKLDGFS